MTFTIREPSVYIHGLTADNYYNTHHQNHHHLFAHYNAPIFYAAGLDLSLAGDTTMRDYFHFWVPKNLDNQPIKAYVRASIVTTGTTSNANAKGLVKLIETTTSTGEAGDVENTTTDCTELANPFTTITLTPTGTATGREFKIQAKCVNSGDTMTIHSIYVFQAGSGSLTTAGLQSSGYRTTDSTNHYAGTDMISTEYMESLMNGPKKIAIDRPACLMCYSDEVYRTPRIATTETDWYMVDRGLLAIPDNVGLGRKYKIHVYLGEDGGATPHFKIGFPGITDGSSVSGTGWQTVEYTLHNPQYHQHSYIPYTIHMKRAGGTRAKLHTVQIFRSV